jgi:hypothetical protein
MESKAKFRPDSGLKLMGQVRQVLRYYHYAYRTEQTYCDWIVRFIRFHGSKRHPKDMGKSEVEGFLSHLATDGKVSASTQQQALNAIIFLYRDVLDQPIQGEIAPVRAKRHAKVPVVMTQGEVQRVLREIHGTHLLMAKLLQALLRHPLARKRSQHSCRSGVDGACGCEDDRDLHSCDAKGCVGSCEPAGPSGEEDCGAGLNLDHWISRKDGLEWGCFLLRRDLYSDAFLK